MSKDQFKFQLKKKLLLFGSLLLVGILAILFFAYHK